MKYSFVFLSILIGWATLFSQRAFAASFDEEARALLLSTDRVEVSWETAYDDGGSISADVRKIEDVPLDSVQFWVEKLSLIPQKITARGWGSEVVPTLYFEFYQAKERIGYVRLNYGYTPDSTFADGIKGTVYNLQPESAFAIRHFVSRQPKLTAELKKLGLKPEDISPDRAYPAKSQSLPKGQSRNHESTRSRFAISK